MGLMNLLETPPVDGSMCFAGRPEVVAVIAMAEEADALGHAAKVMIGEKLEAIAGDPDLKLLKKLAGAQTLEPYVLLSLPDRGIAIDYLGYREKNRKKLEEYLSQFVVPPAPGAAKP
jgi:hypothetical protein